MRNYPTNSRFWEVILGLFLLLLGLSAFAEGQVPALLVLALGGWLLWRQFDGSRTSTPAAEDLQEFESSSRQSGAETVYAHALRAAERAGMNPDAMQVLPVDIGVMAFRGDQEPSVYRTRSVPDDVDYIQPFVQLRLPTKAVGRIKFQIVDSDGQTIFVHEDHYQLERGRNLISPAARLPIHDAQAMHRDWQLRISADGTLLATHAFGWQESDSARIRRHLTEDGEVSGEMRAMLAENRLGKLSLDELLESQEEGEPRADQQQR